VILFPFFLRVHFQNKWVIWAKSCQSFEILFSTDCAKPK